MGVTYRTITVDRKLASSSLLGPVVALSKKRELPVMGRPLQALSPTYFRVSWIVWTVKGLLRTIKERRMSSRVR